MRQFSQCTTSEASDVDEPLPVEIERDRFGANLGREHAFELIKGDGTGAITVCAARGSRISYHRWEWKQGTRTHRSTGMRCSSLRQVV